MKTALSSSIRGRASLASAGTNCGRKAKKKIVSLGFRMLIRIACTITCRFERAPACFSTLSAPIP